MWQFTSFIYKIRRNFGKMRNMCLSIWLLSSAPINLFYCPSGAQRERAVRRAAKLKFKIAKCIMWHIVLEVNKSFTNKHHQMQKRRNRCFEKKQYNTILHWVKIGKRQMRQDSCNIQNQEKWQDLINLIKFCHISRFFIFQIFCRNNIIGLKNNVKFYL